MAGPVTVSHPAKTSGFNIFPVAWSTTICIYKFKKVLDHLNVITTNDFKFDKGTYSTRSKHLQHDWYMGQTEVCTNIIFKSARFCTNL